MIAYLLCWTMVATARATPLCWAWKAQSGFKKVNQDLEHLITTNTIPRYKGIGSAKGLGKRNMSFCVALDEGALAQGDLMSNELQKPKGSRDCFLLMNSATQKTLGIVKHQRRERCFLEEYGFWIELYRTRRSHLHCICISEGFALMDDRQIRFGELNKDSIRRGQLLRGPDAVPKTIKINVEGQLPDEDADADAGRFWGLPSEDCRGNVRAQSFKSGSLAKLLWRHEKVFVA